MEKSCSGEKDAPRDAEQDELLLEAVRYPGRPHELSKDGSPHGREGSQKCKTEGRDFDSTSVQTVLLLFVSDEKHPATHVGVAEWVKR